MDGPVWPGARGRTEMAPEIRRIVAVEVHRRRTGRCPVLVHSLGTGESFGIEPLPEGFRDLASGHVVRPAPEGIHLDGAGPVDIRLVGDVAFEGYDHGAAEAFSGHAGGGASVTLFDSRRIGFFQYAVSNHERDGAFESYR